MVLAKALSITKRQRFIFASIVTLGLSLVFSSAFSQFGTIVIVAYVIALYILTYIAVWENISGIEYVTLFILPILFVIGANLFIQILPERKLFRYPMYLLIPLGTYIILLTENIFNVAAIRTIQLLRAAHAVSYIVTLITAFFIMSYITSMHYNVLYSGLWITAVIIPLTLQFLWTFDLTPKITQRTLLFIGVITLVFVQINLFIHFYPQSIAMTTLFLVAVYYVLLGIMQHFYEKKLTRKPILEYSIVAAIVFIIMILTTSWQG